VEDKVKYFRLASCVIGAFFIALFLPSLFFELKGLSSEKATGLATVAVDLVAVVLSPFFWILAVLCFLLFRWASRSGQPLMRMLLFWIPSVSSSVVGIAVLTSFTYMYLHFRHS